MVVLINDVLLNPLHQIIAQLDQVIFLAAKSSSSFIDSQEKIIENHSKSMTWFKGQPEGNA
jgi:hypothetical protein